MQWILVNRPKGFVCEITDDVQKETLSKNACRRIFLLRQQNRTVEFAQAFDLDNKKIAALWQKTEIKAAAELCSIFNGIVREGLMRLVVRHEKFLC